MTISYRLSDIYNLQMGKTPSRDNDTYWKDGEYEWISIADLSKCDKYISQTKEKITKKAVEESGIHIIPADTVIMSFKLSIGKVAITQKALFSNEAIMAFIDKKVVSISPQYAFYLFSAQNWDAGTNRAVMGSTLNKATLSQYRVLIHDVQTQAEIVERLDKLSDLIRHRRQELQKLDDLVKSQFIEMFGNETNHVPLSHYISALEAGKSLAGKEDNVNKVLKTGAVSYDCFDETQVKNLPLDYMPLIEHRVNDGDILVSRMNTSELVGAAAYVWRAPSNTYIPDRLWRVKCRDCNPVFLWQLLIQPLTKRRIRQIASGTSGSMKNISKQDFLGINVICVGKDKQNQFAAFVEQTDKSKVLCSRSKFLISLLGGVEK